MAQANTLTLKIIDDRNAFDTFSEKPLTESQKELIRFISRMAVEEYIRMQPANAQL